MARTAVGFCLGALLLSVFLLSTLTGLGMNTLVTFYQLCHFVHQPPVTFTPSRPRETRRCAATPRSRAVPGTYIVSLVSFESIVANCQDVPYPYYSPVPLSNTTCILRLRTFPCTVPDGLVCGLCSSTVTPCQRNISYCNRSPTTRTRGTNTNTNISIPLCFWPSYTLCTISSLSLAFSIIAPLSDLNVTLLLMVFRSLSRDDSHNHQTALVPAIQRPRSVRIIQSNVHPFLSFDTAVHLSLMFFVIRASHLS